MEYCLWGMLRRMRHPAWFACPLVCVFAARSLCAATEPDAANVTYTQARRGYYGMEGVWLAQHVPDHGINRDDLIVGWVGHHPQEELRGLVKFTGLDIPPGSEILSADLSFHCGQIYQSPAVSVYGLLNEFSAGTNEWATASPGDSTWNSRRHAGVPWGAPGAGLDDAADTFDGTADRSAEADATATFERRGRVHFDVTRSFRRQFETGKLYGWLLKAPETKPESYAVFAKDRARLEVQFRPPPGVAFHSWTPSGPHLISFDLGYAAAIAKKPARAEELPFDGATFWGVPNDGGQRWMCNSVMGPDPIEVGEYSEFIEDMNVVRRPPSPLQHNFLRVNLCVPGTLEKAERPYTWDTRPRGSDKVTMWWADGFETIVSNIETAAAVAREAGMKGLFLDIEQYGGDIWSHEKLKDAAERGKTIEETRVQVRRRADAFIQGINRVYPDMTLIVIFYLYTEQEHLLWNDFCDGMIAGADPRMRIVNGTERAYGSVSRKEFEALYGWHYQGSLPYCSVPEKYLRQTEMAFGVYFDWKGWGADPEMVSSSALWQAKLENALAITDRYVWVYTGGGASLHPDWWTGNNLPAAYVEATRRGVELARRRRAAE